MNSTTSRDVLCPCTRWSVCQHRTRHARVNGGLELRHLLTKRLIMRMSLTVLLFCLALVQISAKGYGQISLDEKNTPVVTVLQHIKQQTGYVFFYNDDRLQGLQVSIKVKNAPINAVLDHCFKELNLTYRIADKNVFITAGNKKADNQETSATSTIPPVTITGTVTDTTGAPLPGVTIQVRGTANGAITDDKGNFQLEADDAAVLEFKLLGFEPQTVQVGSRNRINVVLRTSRGELGEVVVVGYSTQKKIDVTGSVAQVAAADLVKAPMTNVSQMLTGKLPGVVFQQPSGQPGYDDATMLVRGSGTFNNSSPLMLVDGVERAFGRIDPNDIESVTVLKDAAASAVYGVKGAHGVILITTKRGKAGGKPLFSYTGSSTVSHNTMLPDFLTGTEYAYWHNKANEMDGNRQWFSPEQIAAMTNGDPSDGLENTNWQKEFLGRPALVSQHNMSVSGGADNIRYFTSIGTMQQGGIVKDMKLERYNARANLDMNPNKNWTISLNLAGRVEKLHTPGSASYEKQSLFSPISQALYMYPFLPFEYKGLPTGSSYMTLNPFAVAELSGFQKSANTMIETSTKITYAPSYIQGLKASLFGSYDRKYSDAKTFATPYYVNTFLSETGQYGRTLSDGYMATGSLMQTADNFDYTVFRPSLEYETAIGKHHIGGLFLYEWQKGNSNNFYASRWGYPMKDIPELSFGQQFPPVPNSGGSAETVQAGYVGRLNYSYSRKYLLELAFRSDASYKFPKNSRWGFFPSASAGWVISEESFFKDRFRKVDLLKVRGSAGILGRDNVTPFLYEQYFNLTNTPVIALGDKLSTLYGLSSSTSYPSTNLTWEKTQTYNIGAELSMWKGLLSAEVDVFYKYTYDILQHTGNVYPSSLGGNFPEIENNGSVDVRGIEIQLTHKNRIGKLYYTVGGNFSYSKNRILSIIQTENVHPWQNMIGKSIGQRLAYVATGLYQTQEQLDNSPAPPGGGYKRLGDIMYKDMNGDGKLTREDDMAVATRPGIPPLMYAFNIDLRYGNFDFSMMWQGAALNDILLSGMYDNGIPDNTIFTKPFYGNGYNSPRYLLEDSWTPTHTNARYPRLSLIPSGGNSLDATWWIEPGGYLRLKNTVVGYTLPSSALRAINIKGLRFYLAGTNLFTLSGFKYIDPESPSVNNGYYPQQRTYSVGANLTF
jgi:TonB-linked SusC/RagA family outer membrane protein